MPVFQSIRPPAHSHFWGLTIAVPSLKGEQILVFQQMRDSCITNSSGPNIFSLPSLKALCSESKGPASITLKCVNFTCILFCPARYFAKQNQHQKKTQNKNTHTHKTPKTQTKHNHLLFQTRDYETFFLQYRTMLLCTTYPKIIAWKGIKKYTGVLMKDL